MDMALTLVLSLVCHFYHPEMPVALKVPLSLGFYSANLALDVSQCIPVHNQLLTLSHNGMLSLHFILRLLQVYQNSMGFVC
jgi:hypothetical protein